MKKSIVLFFLISTINCFAQTLVYPVKDASVNLGSAGGDVLWFTYTPVAKNGNVFELYYTFNGLLGKANSPTGTNWTTISYVTTPMSESIIKKGNIWYMGYHKTYNDSVYFFTTQSSNGVNFPAGTPRFYSGEDMTFTVVNDSFYCYIRPKAPREDLRRKIGLTKSKNFSDWTSIQTILAIDSSDFNDINSPDYKKTLYNMSVFKNGADWWGILNVYRVGDLGQDVEQLPPYNTLEHTVEPQLVYSKDGINWKRTNNRQAFIPRTNGMMEVFGLPTVVNDKLWIYTIESKRRHTDYESQNINGRYFGIYRYRMNMSDLEAWKPVTRINLTLAVEGLLNESGKHNSSENVSVFLRRNYYPYTIVDSAVGKIDSVSLTGSFAFSNVTSGNYYMTVNGKNILETWSKNLLQINEDQTLNVDFTSSASLAYGDNLKYKHGRYCVYSGDIDNNNIIGLSDVVLTFADMGNFFAGAGLTDLNGDHIVDLKDLNLIDNNSHHFISVKRPY